MLFLEQIFERFCNYLDGKLKWADPANQWTEVVFGFFAQENAAQAVPYLEITEHMRVDYIWRYNRQRYSINDIELAVESENEENSVDELITHEIQHLVDIRAHYKIAILYTTLGDQSKLLERTSKTIKMVDERYRVEEQYLIILGHQTTTEGKHAIQWRGVLFNKNGEETGRKMERLTLQRNESRTAPTDL